MKRHIPVQIEWHPDPAQPVPVYRQILEWMYGKMESGEWPAGTRLPSQRAMARHFQVNRSTLNQALKPLLEAGVLQGRGSQGTVVASTAWSLRLPVQPDWNHYMTAGYFRANQEVVQAINSLEFDDRLVRLGTGELDPRLFPQDAFRQTMRDVADAITSLGYVEPLGMPVLRQTLADYARKRGLAVSPSSILITSGASRDSSSFRPAFSAVVQRSTSKTRRMSNHSKSSSRLISVSVACPWTTRAYPWKHWRSTCASLQI